MPFITEEIWTQFSNYHNSTSKSLMVSDYPNESENLSEEDFQTIEWLKEVVSGIRNIRGELLIKPSIEISATFKGGEMIDQINLEKVISYIKKLSSLKDINWAENDSEDPPSSIFTLGKLKVMIPLEGLIDVHEETERLDKKINKLTKEQEMLASKLANKNFTENAPKDLVDSQKERLSTLSSELENLNHQMSELKKLI